MDEAMLEIRRLRRSAWLWRGAGLLAVAWAMFRPVGAVEPQDRPLKAIRAEALIIVDDKNQDRMVLSCEGSGPSINMLDARADGRIQITASESTGPFISLMGKKGKGRLQFGVSPHDTEPANIDTLDDKGNAYPLIGKDGRPIR